jgi:hypothetical protein
VRNDILKVWNKNGQFYRYKCYRLIFEVDVKVDNGANRVTVAVAKDRVGVRIEKSAVGFRSFVQWAGGIPGKTWDDPATLGVPDNRLSDPTTWAYPPRGDALYAHEFGHVIGLDDAYDDVVVEVNGKKETHSKTKKGAPHDLMSAALTTDIDQRTINLLVRRSGIEDTLECDYKIDTKVDWFHFEALKCETAEGTWHIVMTGVRDLGVGSLVAQGNADVNLLPPDDASSAVLDGGWNAEYRIDLEGSHFRPAVRRETPAVTLGSTPRPRISSSFSRPPTTAATSGPRHRPGPSAARR